MDKLLWSYKSWVALPKDISEDLAATCLTMFNLQYSLYEHFRDQDGMQVPLYGITSKAHMLYHSCQLSVYRGISEFSNWT